MFIGVHVKYPVFSYEFNKTLISSIDFRDIFNYQISSKSVEWEPSFYVWTDRQTTEMTKLIAIFHNFAKATNRGEF